MLVPLLLALVPSAPLAMLQLGPMQQLVSSYTSGEQLSLEVTPDGKRGFLAEGATIVMLNLEVTPPVVIASHPMPYCQPLAMRYYHDSSGADQLFIAGGALGAWRVTVCSNYFQSPPTSCSNGFVDLLVQAPIEHGNFERKRCVDVDVVPTTSGPALFALFAASSNPCESSGGPTELRAYTWTSTTATQIASHTFGVATNPVEVGTALAVDPVDVGAIYVALGKGGIRHVTLSGSLMTEQLPATWDCSTCTPHYCPEHVRDMSIVRVATTPPKSVLYATLNYNELLEIVDVGGSPTCSILSLNTTGPSRPPGWAERVAAFTNAGSSVLVAVTTQTDPGKYEDSLGPRNVNSFWSGICLDLGKADPSAPSLPGTRSQVQFYKHDFATSGSALTCLSFIDYDALGLAKLGMGWNNAILQASTAGNDRLFLCSRDVGTEVYSVNSATGASTQVGVPFVGDAFRGQDSVVSALNQGIVEFGQEWVGAVDHPKQMLYIDVNFPYAITPVARTSWSPCTNDYPTPPLGCSGISDPALYASGILDEAHWANPTSQGREYFLAGRRILERFDSTCTPIADCAAPPCSSGTLNWLRERKFLNPQGYWESRTGWTLMDLMIPSQGPPVDGPSLDPKWSQIDVSEVTGEQSGFTDDRVQTLADQRMTNGLPNALYLTRSGTSHGVKVVLTSALLTDVSALCSSMPQGAGEYLSLPSTDYKTVLTHLELEGNGGQPCNAIAPCPLGVVAGKRQLIQNHTDLFRTRDLNGRSVWILAIAAGFPASGPSDPPNQIFQSQSCQWTQVAGFPMLVLVDVTHVGSPAEFHNPAVQPVVLRVGLGTYIGHAFCVRTKAFGSRTYAFVGDVVGRILVFDVTGSNLFPAPTPGTQYITNTPFLSPVADLALPFDPFDGQAANCVDIEIDGNFLYCVLGRLGIGIVDITNPLGPTLYDVIDTPGMVLGLSKRMAVGGAGNVTQLIVGDSRCGVRVYQ